MNRWLHYLNLCGVVVLATVCVIQWRRDRVLNLEVSGMEKARLEQKGKISEQEKSLQGVTADLTAFKDQLGRAQIELSDSQRKVQELDRENHRLAGEGEQLRQNVTNWANAVTERDRRLIEANARIGELADRLNASVQKFNELATNYNAVVKDLNDARSGKTNGPGARAAR